MAIVDDEDIIVNGLKNVIEWEKHSCMVVATACDAKSGAAIIREHRPDILFTDIRMPGIDGLTMLAGLKAEFPAMEVTVLTGHREFEYAKRAITVGVRRYLLKPSKMGELEEALCAMTAELNKRSDEKASSFTGDKADESATLYEEGNEASSFIVNSAIKHIEEHYAEKLSLSELADTIYVSQWYLSKLLNRHTGKSFYELVNTTRIARAKQLLANPALKIHEISDMVGFNDVAHFSKIFKKLVNVSPKEYRNTIA